MVKCRDCVHWKAGEGELGECTITANVKLPPWADYEDMPYTYPDDSCDVGLYRTLYVAPTGGGGGGSPRPLPRG